MNLLTPPASDEFEFSLFGPGRGECIVLHLGANDWAVVDSCAGPGRRESVALEYFRRIGVTPDRIRLVLATHWHDDHTKGLANLHRAAVNARIGMSAAFKINDLGNLIACADPVHRRSGVDEFAAITTILSERRETHAPGDLGEFIWAYPGRVLLELADGARPFPASIRSLNPSDASFRSAWEEISAALPREGEATRVIRHRSPNRASIVVSVTAGATRLLLGADLEHSAELNDGWFAIIAQHDGLGARALKVPHHGSPNADTPEMWSTMLLPNVVATIAPYSSGVTPRPSETDLQRLSSRTAHVYCTAKPSGGNPPRRDALIQKQLKRIAKSHRVVSGECGHIRVRWLPLLGAASPSIDLLAGAYRVTTSSAA